MVRKIEKSIAVNAGKIVGAYEEIEAVRGSIEGHMELVNA